ncbi:NEDD8-activating enzyme E1 catalytic subunit [Armadillidium vulgare]|nr:NEDD8-activating enzyme E1 catalytic subunit [Armadillidium vulgare]
MLGAGGLGCELLKDLALMGFNDIHVIDMDVIDLSNLNRQFLFRKKDIGRPKADVAAEFINDRIEGCKVTPLFLFTVLFKLNFIIVIIRKYKILVKNFIKAFTLWFVVWTRWLLEDGLTECFTLVLNYEDGMLDQTSIIPLVDGGTEGFKGNARVILPGMTSCIECTLDLFPPQVNFPLCTIAHTPRLPEHCIEYVRLLLWSKENPFGEDIQIDGDDPLHISWICEKAQKRAAEYGINGVTYRLTQGVVKRIIPAVASTNAVIAAACATEVFKLVTSSCKPMNNYCIFNDSDAIYTYTYEQEKKEDCLVCSQIPQELKFSPTIKLSELITYLKESPTYQMKSPGLQAMVNGKIKSLYLSSPPSIEEKLRPNLSKTLRDIGLINGNDILVADVTNPSTMVFKLSYNVE